MSWGLFGLLITWPVALVIKVTLVLGVAAGLAFVLGRAAASTRHLVWLAAVIASLGLAVASPIVPALGVPLRLKVPPRLADELLDLLGGTERTSQPLPIEIETRVRALRHVAAPIATARERIVQRAIRRTPRSDTFDLNPRYFIAGAWLVGFLVMIGRCIAGHVAVARLVSRARQVTSFEWRASIDDALDTARVSRGVSVLVSDDIAAPVTSGAMRPVVLLPSDATLWSEERRRVVLIHELAHIARFDYVAQLVATIVCALFWFHPLAWFAAARLRSEAEHAADDCVLVAGTPGVSYASHLLDLARVEHSPHLSAAVAVGMVKASRLEGRFRAMLDANRSRSALSPSVQAMATSLTLAAMVPFAGLRAIVAPSPVAFWRVPSVTTTQVVGQVQTADPAMSIAIPYTQPDFRASAMTSDGSVFGIVYPRTANAGDPYMLELRGVPKRTELEPGTMIFTSGLGHTFPRGIAIGTVVQELKTAEVWTRSYLVRPVVSPSRVNAVAATLQEIVAADSMIEKTIDAAPGERLVLDLQTGGSIVLRGWDEPRVRVRARLAGDDWRDTRVSLERTNRGIRLTSEFSGSASNRSTRHAFELWVPRGINVELSSAGGSIAISDVTGEFRGHTGGGSLVIEGVSGNARLTTGGGDVRVSNSRLDGSVSTGGGEVVIANVSGSLVGSSGSGPVITTGVGSGIGQGLSGGKATTVSGAVTVVGRGEDATTIVRGSAGYGYGYGSGTGATIGSTATAGGGAVRTVITGQGGFATTPGAYTGPIRLSLSKAGGDIVMDTVEDGARLNTGGGRIYVGSSSGFLSVSTGGGDIDLPRVGGDVYASTGSGDVTITVVNANGSAHSVDVFTGHGQLVLELPADLDARFELETAYTKRRTSIDSDFSLTQTETNDWDDSQGTPRKYVRARGTFGNGRGLIRVRVVNGDIVVRRTGG